MLRELRIKNFAVIDEVALELGPGLNVLTGETGAGKTIVLNALALLSGGRVFSEIIRQGEEEARVEALFDDLPEALRERLREEGYGDDNELLVKRIISRSGRNRIYLNGSLCPLGLLSEVGDTLIHIYGQHEHQGLLRPETHLRLLDDYGAMEEKVAEMRASYRALAFSWERLREAKEVLEGRKREEELLRSQAEELSRARLQPGEEEELKAKRNILVHAEKLYQGCKEGEDLLYEGEDAVASRLGRYLHRLQEMAQIDESLQGAVDLLQSSLAQLEETTSILRRHTDRLHFDPASLGQLDDRLAEISRLRRKYNATVEELVGIEERVRRDVEALERGAEEIPALEKLFEEARGAAWEQAALLSAERKRQAKRFKREMEKEAAALGMPGTVFEARFLAEERERDDPPFRVGGMTLSEQGMDQVEFYFSPNPGETAKPLARTASGGELSRLMLAVKSLILSRGDIPTLLFDEVDAGIGGRVAEIVGKRLKKVAASHQVLCVTHLPQIAALADTHYRVEKWMERARTFTEVKKLTDKERVSEVARMLGGVRVTQKTRQHAEEMVKVQTSSRGQGVDTDS